MNWMRKNIVWLGPSVFLLAAILAWGSGAFGFFVAIEAKPVAKEVAEEEVKIHELRMEPRLQAIEMQQKTMTKQSNEALKILRKLDPDGE
jgi:hypothetical protein